MVERGVVHERFLGGVGCEVLSAALGVGGVSEAYCAAYQSAGRAEGAMMAHCGVRWADLSDLVTQFPEFDGLRNEHACGVGKGECENMCDESHELRYLGYLSDFAGDGLLGKGASGVDGCECERVGGECSGAIEEVPHALGHGMQGVDAQGDSELHWLAELHAINAQSCGKISEFVACPTEGDVDALVCEEGYAQGMENRCVGEWRWLDALRAINAQRCVQPKFGVQLDDSGLGRGGFALAALDSCMKVTQGSEEQHGSDLLRLAGQVERDGWPLMPRAEVCGSDFPLGSNGGDRRDVCAGSGIGADFEHGQGVVRLSRNARRQRQRRQQRQRNEACATTTAEPPIIGAQTTDDNGRTLLQDLGSFLEMVRGIACEGRVPVLAPPELTAAASRLVQQVREYECRARHLRALGVQA